MLIFPTVRDYSVSNIAKSIKQSTSRKAINWLKQNKSEFLKKITVGQKYERHRFWQDGGGYDRNIFTYKAARSSVDYMHQNPVRRKLVESPHLWEYSSFLYWQKSVEGPIDVCLTKFPTG
jgi:putative transposase